MSSSVQEEQVFIDYAHDLLDHHIQQLRTRIESITNAPGTGTGQDEIEREALLDNANQQLAAALAARSRVCFGRISYLDGADHHIGRIGLRSPEGEVVLVDWRAPQAAPFYQATTQEPLGLSQRRRIATRTRIPTPEVTHVDDEYFSLDPPGLGHDSTSGASAGAAAMQAPRTGRMADILASIAADQDAIIRSPLNQVTVVEGGPGTGKTVVALHRAAWLLYTYRQKLAKDAVLVIGPSNVFLKYIDQVLPSLGETDVVLLTPARLYPGVHPRRTDAAAVAAIKGDARMAAVLERAVAARVRIPTQALTLTTATGTRIRLEPHEIHAATRGISRTHNFHAGREPFLRRLLLTSARHVARDTGHDPDDQDYCQDIIASLVEDSDVRREFNLMWLPTTPERIVSRILTNPQALAAAAQGVLNDTEQRLLLRTDPNAWTIDDVPLLDEVAHLLGPWEPPSSVEPETDYRELRASDAYRIKSAGHDDVTSSVAERAIDDREWIYGHVIVDEAQELSAMTWRAIQRRASRKSMTIVGDLQQSSHPASPRTWDQALPWAKDKLHLHTLSVTYRITREIARAATELLLAAGGDPPTLTPIRDGDPVVRVSLPLVEVHRYVARTRSLEGRNALIVPDEFHRRMRQYLNDAEFGFDDEALDAPVAVVTVQQSKGLEFDCVFVLDPAGISRQHDRGADIYVAATRATQHLHLIYLASEDSGP